MIKSDWLLDGYTYLHIAFKILTYKISGVLTANFNCHYGRLVWAPEKMF